MVTSNPVSNSDNYPDALRAKEAEQIRVRRTGNKLDPDTPPVGVGLSGGGIRSATFCIGLFQALSRQKLVRRIDYLSTVSGGGYFGSFLGAAFSRERANADRVEAELSDNHSWSIQWLRDNGRFLSPNGAGDGWMAAAVVLRNWVALHFVMLAFAFFVFGLGVLVRTELGASLSSRELWMQLERGIWQHQILGMWWSPWLLLPVVPFVFLMLPAGCLYWATQCTPLMVGLRKLGGVFSKKWASYSNREFVGYAQNRLTRMLVLGMIPTVALLGYAVIDSLGQTAYWKWSAVNFEFPALWAGLTVVGVGVYGFASKIYILAESLLGKGKLKLTFDMIALAAALAWSLLIVVSVSVAACWLAWSAKPIAIEGKLQLIGDPWMLSVAVAVAFGLSWVFSRSFSFVNMSSLQQLYAARLRRAYIGATNPERKASSNYSMTELIAGDDLSLDDYHPHKHGGPLHLVNVTVNETLSGKTQIERRDRKGLAMSVGPCGISVGTASHALWTGQHGQGRQRKIFSALWDDPSRYLESIRNRSSSFNALQSREVDGADPALEGAGVPRRVEGLSIGRWIAISGAAFTTGLGARTNLGLSLLLGLANVRLGYWWDGGSRVSRDQKETKPTFGELWGRLLNFVLPVQTCLINEFFARFHGPARRYWYLSDGGHFENTACYELVRRRVPFIICTDSGEDQQYRFDDLANLVRKARTDFGAEIEVIRHARNADKKEPGHDLPTLEQLVHPDVVDMFGAPEDFPSLNPEAAPDYANLTANRRHALLARIRYLDTGEMCWLLVIKPSLGGDEPVDVVQYQRTQPLFPQEPTSDQYFDEAQWDSYRKLGEHIGSALFEAPTDGDPRWSPSCFAAPAIVLKEDSGAPVLTKEPFEIGTQPAERR